MSTNAFYGFRKNSNNKITYCHYDGYIESGLGEKIIKFIKNNSIPELNDIYSKITLINKKDLSENSKYMKVLNLSKLDDINNLTFYELEELMYGIEGQIDIYQSGFDLMLEEKNIESTKCQYGYIINLDKNVLNIYKANKLKTSLKLDDILKVNIEHIIKKIKYIDIEFDNMIY